MKKFVTYGIILAVAVVGIIFFIFMRPALGMDEKVYKTVLILFGIVGCYGIAKTGGELGKKMKNNYAKTWFFLCANGFKYLSVVVGSVMVLRVFGIDTTAIVTGAGVITIIIGLGCQTLFSDIISGVFLLLEGNIKIGDIVEIGNFRGTVQQMNIRTVSLLDAGGNIKTVNNSAIQEITNRSDRLSFACLEIGIEYEESLERVEKIVQENMGTLLGEVPTASQIRYKGVSCLDESAVKLLFTAECKEEDRFQTERELNRAIKLLFDKEGIKIPYRQMVVRKNP